MSKPEITVKKSYGAERVRIGVQISVSGYFTHGSESAAIKTAFDISTSEARTLAAALIAEADRADAVAAKKKVEDDRRSARHAREIANGTRVVFGAAEFFGKR